MSTDPSVYVIDTPGIMPPKLEDVTAGLRMALACMDGVRWGKGEAVALTHIMFVRPLVPSLVSGGRRAT